MPDKYDSMSDDELLAMANQPRQRPHVAWNAQWYGSGGQGMNPDFMGQVNQLADEFYRTYHRPLTITSGYRPRWREEELWRSGVRPSVPPGRTSRHTGWGHGGEAVDIASSDIRDVQRLPLSQLGLETLARINDPGHIQSMYGPGQFARASREAGVRGASQQDPYAKMSDDELLALANRGAPAKTKPAATAWTMKASELPGLQQAAANPTQFPNAQYETKLSPEKEKQFQQWFEQQYKAGNIREGDYKFYKENGYGYDYDFRAAFDKGLKPGGNGHWGDYGKKPQHETFSVESKYSNVPGTKPGSWQGEQYQPWAAPQGKGAPPGAAAIAPGGNQLKDMINKVMPGATTAPWYSNVLKAIDLPHQYVSKPVGEYPASKIPEGTLKMAPIGESGDVGREQFDFSPKEFSKTALPLALDFPVYGGAGKLLKAGAKALPGVMRAPELTSMPWAPGVKGPFSPWQAKPPGGTAAAAEADADLYEAAKKMMGDQLGASPEAPKAESALAATPAPAGPPTAGMTTFNQGFTPPREPLKPWYPLGEGGTASVPPGYPFFPGRSPAMAPNIYPSRNRPVDVDIKKLKEINKDISLGIRGVDPGVRSAMAMIDRLRSLA